MLKIEKIKIAEVGGLGKGEASSLEVYKKKKCNAIITDDRKFLKVLEERGIPFIAPSDVIERMYMKKQKAR